MAPHQQPSRTTHGSQGRVAGWIYSNYLHHNLAAATLQGGAPAPLSLAEFNHLYPAPMAAPSVPSLTKDDSSTSVSSEDLSGANLRQYYGGTLPAELMQKAFELMRAGEPEARPEVLPATPEEEVDSVKSNDHFYTLLHGNSFSSELERVSCQQQENEGYQADVEDNDNDSDDWEQQQSSACDSSSTHSSSCLTLWESENESEQQLSSSGDASSAHSSSCPTLWNPKNEWDNDDPIASEIDAITREHREVMADLRERIATPSLPSYSSDDESSTYSSSGSTLIDPSDAIASEVDAITREHREVMADLRERIATLSLPSYCSDDEASTYSSSGSTLFEPENEPATPIAPEVDPATASEHDAAMSAVQQRTFAISLGHSNSQLSDSEKERQLMQVAREHSRARFAALPRRAGETERMAADRFRELNRAQVAEREALKASFDLVD